jgi:hypothetical protein
LMKKWLLPSTNLAHCTLGVQLPVHPTKRSSQGRCWPAWRSCRPCAVAWPPIQAAACPRGCRPGSRPFHTPGKTQTALCLLLRCLRLPHCTDRGILCYICQCVWP